MEKFQDETLKCFCLFVVVVFCLFFHFPVTIEFVVSKIVQYDKDIMFRNEIDKRIQILIL